MIGGNGGELSILVAFGGESDDRGAVIVGPSGVTLVATDNPPDHLGENETGRERQRSAGDFPTTDGSGPRRVLTDGGTVSNAAEDRPVGDWIDDLEADLSRVERTVESLEDRVDERARREYVDAQLDALTAVIDDVDRSVEELETAFEGTADTAAGGDAETVESLEADTESLTSDLESLRSDVESLSDELESVSEAAVDESDLNAATKGLADADRIRELEEAVPMVVKTVENLETAVSNRLESLEAYDGPTSDEDLDALEERVRMHLDGIHSELSTLDAALAEIRGTVSEVERAVESTDETLETVRNDLREEVEAVHDEFETVRERIDAVETRVTDVRDDAADPDRLDELEGTVAELRTTLESLEREAVTTESVTQLRAELARTRRRVEDVGETFRDVEARVETVDAAVEDVEESVDTLEPTVTDLRADVEANRDRLETLSADLEAVETSVESDTDLESAVDGVESSVDDLETRVDRINGKLESDLKTLHLEIADLRERGDADERSLLERMVTDDVFGLVTLAFVAISAIGASMGFFDGRYAVAAVFAAVPIATVLGAHVLAQRS